MSFRLDINELLGRVVEIPLRNKTGIIRQHTQNINYRKLVRSCSVCELSKGVITPKMKPFGKGRKNGMLIGEAPGRIEDEKGKPWRGKSGAKIKGIMKKLDFNLDIDFFLSNVVQCRPPQNKFPKDEIAYSCFKRRLEKQILEFKPTLIIAAGFNPSRFLLDLPVLKSASGKTYKWDIGKLRGRLIPSHRYNCWIAPIWHPSYILRNPDYENIYVKDFEYILKHGFDKEELKKRLNFANEENEGNILLTKFSEAKTFLEELIKTQRSPVMYIDYETTGIDPFDDDTELLTIAFADRWEKGYCIPLDFPPDIESNWGGWTKDEKEEIFDLLRIYMLSKKVKGAQNKKFENMMTQSKLGVRPVNLMVDTMHTSHVIDARKGTAKLDIQEFFHTGKIYSDMVDHARLKEMPLKTVAKYNTLDVRYLPVIAKEHAKRVTGTRLGSGIMLLNDGANLFANMETRGVAVDRNELNSLIDWSESRLSQLEMENLSGDIHKKWKRKNKEDINLNSGEQLSRLFYKTLKLKPIGEKSKVGNYSLDEDNLKDLLNACRDKEVKSFISNILAIRKLTKFKSTYLISWQKKLDKNGLLHPSFWILTDTYRSNSENPNFQNIPAHDKELIKVRKCIIPHLGKYFLESDYGAMEVRVIAMLSQDPVLMKFIREDIDFHRDWASKIFCKRKQDITKEERFNAKNSFVFALFYGSYYKSVHRSFVKLGYDISEKHFQKLEQEFWKMFAGVAAWQKSLLKFYNKHGFIELASGFRRYGPINRNMIYNTPVQGLAFHFLLQSLIEIDNIMIAENMKSGLEIQCHDSATFDSVEDELEDIFELSTKIMLKNRYPFQNIPLKLEWKLGVNWLEMEEF